MTLKTQSKSFCILFGALLLYHNATSNPRIEKPSLEQQLAAYIQYPPMLNKTSASVLSLSFCMDNNRLITQV